MPNSDQPSEANAFTRQDINLRPEEPDDRAQIDVLLDRVFGPDRQKKAVYSLRKGLKPILELSTVARVQGTLRGSIRYSRVKIDPKGVKALLLGPLAVDPEVRGTGVGMALMKHTLDTAKSLGHRIVILVGEAPYYARVGFSPEAAKNLMIKGQADRSRILGLALSPGALDGVEGVLMPDNDPSVSQIINDI